MYEVFEHTADLGLRIRAADLETLFVDAARGLTSLLVADLDTVEPRESQSFVITGDKLDYLLFDWLSELLFAFESRHVLFSRFEATIDADGLSATAHGEPMDLSRHTMEHEVKAITYHGLKVEETPSGWLAEAIIDI